MAGRKPNAPQYKTILIIVVGEGKIMIIDLSTHLPVTILSKHNNNEAEWKIIPSGRKFTVKFDKGDGTPFRDNEFSGDDTVVSGPIVVDPQVPPKLYQYSVEVEGVGRIDPGIYIWDGY